MKTTSPAVLLILLIAILGCSKNSSTNDPQLNIPIPNGDFEYWSGSFGTLSDWQTNSCPPCMTPIEMNIVQRDASAYSGQWAAKFIYNNVFPGAAQNKFYIPAHPSALVAYVKTILAPSDTVSISVKLYSGAGVVDSGQWYGTASIANYTKITIPITQSTPGVDSAFIKIEGGHKGVYSTSSSQFWVDDLSFESH